MPTDNNISDDELRHTLELALEGDREFGDGPSIANAVKLGLATYNERTDTVTVTAAGRRFVGSGH